MNIKLKLVVASMSVLGLIATPSSFAAKKHHKKKHHHNRHHHHVHHAAAAADYKDMGSLPVQAAPMEPACSVNPANAVMDDLTHNAGRALPSNCNPGWWNRIALSGGMNFDLLKLGNRDAGFMGQNYKRLSINDAYLNVSGTVNEWVRGFASISYANPSDLVVANRVAAAPNANPATPAYTYLTPGSYGANYGNNVLTLEQAYVVISNFDVSPVFVQLGKGFQGFGKYDIHPITRSTTQVLSEILATSARVGFVTPMGFNGSLYGFENSAQKVGNAANRRDMVWGASLGFDSKNDQMGYDVGIGYLSNFWAVNDAALLVSGSAAGGYNSSKAAYTLYGDVNSGPFSANARYVGVNRLDVRDLPAVNGGVPSLTEGAKPWALSLQAGYNFEGMGKNQNVYLGYQMSRQAASFALPKNRWVLGYNIDAWKYTNFGVEFNRDKDYSVSNGIPAVSTDQSYNLLSLRAAIKFS